MVRKLSVSLSRESIRRYVIDAANLARDALITKLKGKLVYIKIVGATRQLRSFLGINVQYYDKIESKAVVKTLTCADSEKNTQVNKCVKFLKQLCKNLMFGKKMYCVW